MLRLRSTTAMEDVMQSRRDKRLHQVIEPSIRILMICALSLVPVLSTAANKPSNDHVLNESGSKLPADFYTFTANLGDYFKSGILGGSFSQESLGVASGLYITGSALNLEALNKCLQDHSQSVFDAISKYGGGYETSFVVTRSSQTKEGIVKIEFAQSHVGGGGKVDQSEFYAMYVDKTGILGFRPPDENSGSRCWESHITRGPQAEKHYIKADDAVYLPTERKAATDSSHTIDQSAQTVTSVTAANTAEPIRSTGNNKWDLITTDDPSVLECTVYNGRGRGEIFDKRIDQAITHPNAFLFTAYYRDGTQIAIRLHPEFGSDAEAIEEVQRYTLRLGQLPTILRENIQRFAIMKGDKTAMADGQGEGIHIQSDNARLRESHNRLEETLFHEAVHTSLDDLHANSPEWIQAQKKDNLFLTSYGRKKPAREDLAESMLYGFALLHHPQRIPGEFKKLIENRIPHRIKYIEKLLPPGHPIFSTTDVSAEACEAR